MYLSSYVPPVKNPKYRLGVCSYLTFPCCLLPGEEGDGGKEAAENPDQEVIVEALKSICNILLHNEIGQVSLPCFPSHLHPFIQSLR